MPDGQENYNTANVQMQGFSKYHKMVSAAERGVIKYDIVKRAALFVIREYMRDQRGLNITIPQRMYDRWLYSDAPVSPNILPSHFREWVETKVGSSYTSFEGRFTRQLSENEQFRLAFTQAFWEIVYREFHSQPKTIVGRNLDIRLFDHTYHLSTLGDFSDFLNPSVPEEELFITHGVNYMEVDESEEVSSNGSVNEPQQIEGTRTDRQHRGRSTNFEVNQRSISQGLSVLLGQEQFISTQFDSATARMISDYIEYMGKLEIELTSDEYAVVSVKEKGLYPNYIPESFIVFLENSGYEFAKEVVELIRSKSESMLVRLFKYYFWKIILGHSKQYSPKILPDVVIKYVPKPLSDNLIGKDEVKSITGMLTGNKKINTSNDKPANYRRSMDIGDNISGEMLNLARKDNPLADFYFRAILRLFRGNFTLYLSKNLYLHITRGQLPDPDFVLPKQVIDLMISFGVIKSVKDLGRYNSAERSKAFGFMYIFWLIVQKIPLDTGAVVVYERQLASSTVKANDLGINYRNLNEVPEEYVHQEILDRDGQETPSRIREDHLNLSLQNAFSLKMFAGEVKGNDNENEESAVEQ